MYCVNYVNGQKAYFIGAKPEVSLGAIEAKLLAHERQRARLIPDGEIAGVIVAH